MNEPPDKSWLVDPSLLLSANLPLCSTSGASRLFLLVGLVWSIVERSATPFLVMFTAAVLMTIFLKPQLGSAEIIYRPQIQQQMSYTNPYHLRQSAQQPQYTYSQSAQQPAYMSNPMPLGSYHNAVRSTCPMIETQHADYLRRMYSQVDVLPVEFFLNPIPDPTLSSRYPSWWQSSEVDRSIVADSGNMRYIR